MDKMDMDEDDMKDMKKKKKGKKMVEKDMKAHAEKMGCNMKGC